MIYENLMKIEIRIEGYCVYLRVQIFALSGNIYFPFPPFEKFKLDQTNFMCVCVPYKEHFFGEDIVK